jgi:hypothetical protein
VADLFESVLSLGSLVLGFELALLSVAVVMVSAIYFLEKLLIRELALALIAV